MKKYPRHLVRNRDFDIWMIRIKGNEVSETYARICAKTWTDAGFHVNFFDAVTPKDLHLNTKYKFIHERKGGLSDTSKAGVLSHIYLWEKCAESDKPFLILEHDAWLEKPEVIVNNPSVFLSYFSQNCMEAVMYKPHFCRYLVDKCEKFTFRRTFGGKLERGILEGPFGLLESIVGYADRPMSLYSNPFEMHIGKHSPVKHLAIKELGNTTGVLKEMRDGKILNFKERLNHSDDQHKELLSKTFKVVNLSDVDV